MKNLLVVLCLVLSSSFVWSQTEWTFNRMIAPDGQEYLVRGKVSIHENLMFIDVNDNILQLDFHRAEETTLKGHPTALGIYTDSLGDLVYVYVPKGGMDMMVVEDVRRKQFLIFYNENK